ncbi:MAG: exodeoxyribonuclease VII large subunit [Turicibacter sp.]|nr:exodeoxyribonuclease VII large subunit [Turicibacter sp.]MEE0880107.1 exodeoxyribonuclease VII large subunit [Turicibacter sp.]
MDQRQPLTVKALTKYIKLKFDYDKNLQHLLLKGELSNVKRHSRGHLYFTLKDDEAQINAVMFASAASQLDFVPTEGMQVVVKGHITVYEAGGSYSMYVKEMTEDGIGNLYIAFTQMKERLGAEGLFDARFKQPIPSYPHAVGVITSPTGAAIRDILSTIKRRFPLVKVYIYPALVQGEQAESSIISCIKQANDMQLVDTLIVGRGGGSIEDLWAFNKEGVARAIFESKIPIISAVGHETDFTIADFVADHRAPTPTGAAEMAVPNLPDVLKHFNQLNVRLNQSFNTQLEQKKLKLNQLSNHYIMKNPHALFEQKVMYVNQLSDKLQFVLQDQLNKRKAQLAADYHRLNQFNPTLKVEHSRQQLDFLMQRLTQSMNQQLLEHKQNYHVLLTKLEILNPLSILKKGYSVLTDEFAQTITTVEAITIGQTISVALDDGIVKASVKEIEPSVKKFKG